MMRFTIETPIPLPAEEVYKEFDRPLLEKLLPAFPPAKLLRFDGKDVGSLVTVSIWTPLGRTAWTVKITERGEDNAGFYFVDEGHDLPPFLKAWRHEHRVNRNDNEAVIIDDISFEVAAWLPAKLVYNQMKQQFKDRQPLYRKHFGV